MTTTNIAEVLKLAAKLIQYDNDEKNWLEFHFKLENYLTLVDERYVALLLNAESQPVANLPTGTEESAVTIRTLSHTRENGSFEVLSLHELRYTSCFAFILCPLCDNFFAFDFRLWPRLATSLMSFDVHAFFCCTTVQISSYGLRSCARLLSACETLTKI